MKISAEKSRFLCLAYQAQAGSAVDRNCLAMMEAEVKHLHEELEASQRLRKELAHREA